MSAPSRDSRGFPMLPQGYEGGGYYTYGRPGAGQFQYAHPTMMTLLLRVAGDWCAVDPRKFGIGNISLADGRGNNGHRSHRNGRQVDVRVIRIDGRHLPCTRFDSAYDRSATYTLIQLFRRAGAKRILFNDLCIPGVRMWEHHDDHFHVEI